MGLVPRLVLFNVMEAEIRGDVHDAAALVQHRDARLCRRLVRQRGERDVHVIQLILLDDGQTHLVEMWQIAIKLLPGGRPPGDGSQFNLGMAAQDPRELHPRIPRHIDNPRLDCHN